MNAMNKYSKQKNTNRKNLPNPSPKGEVTSKILRTDDRTNRTLQGQGQRFFCTNGQQTLRTWAVHSSSQAYHQKNGLN